MTRKPARQPLEVTSGASQRENRLFQVTDRATDNRPLVDMCTEVSTLPMTHADRSRKPACIFTSCERYVHSSVLAQLTIAES